jgi:group I intron endonuclease
MQGFAYTISEYWRSPCRPTPTYEAVRRVRPLVVHNLKAFHESTKMFLSATGGQEARFIVYAAINKFNDKIYVGMTSMGLNRRKTGHFVAANQGRKSLFCSALRKYGKDGFDWIIIGGCEDASRARDLEQNAIASIMPEYNMTSGGEGGGGAIRKLQTWDPSTAEISALVAARELPKLYVRNLGRGGRPKSKETKDKMAKARRRWWEAKRDDKEFMERYRETTKRSGLIGGMMKARRVVCITDGNKIFESVNSAARFYKISIGTVNRSCKKNGAYKRKMRHRFVYLDSVQ